MGSGEKKPFYFKMGQNFLLKLSLVEDDDLAQALKLSLQTAQEDEKRRLSASQMPMSSLKKEKNDKAECRAKICKEEANVSIKQEKKPIKLEKKPDLSIKQEKKEQSSESIVISSSEDEESNSKEIILKTSAGNPLTSFGLGFDFSENDASESPSDVVDEKKQSPKLRNRSQKRRYTFDSSDDEGPLEKSAASNGSKRRIIESSDEEYGDGNSRFDEEKNDSENFQQDEDSEDDIRIQSSVRPDAFQIIDSDDEFDEPLDLPGAESDLNQSTFDVGNQPPVHYREKLKAVLPIEI